MRIVITSNYEIGNETGTAFVAENLSKKLSKNNHVMYLCLGKEFKHKKITKNLEVITINSIKINNAYFPFITPVTMYKVFKALDKFKPDIVHTQNSWFISNLVQTWTDINNVPFVTTFHHIPTEVVQHLLPSMAKNYLANLAQDIYKEVSLKNFLSKTDGVIALNPKIFNSVRSVNQDIYIEVINNGIDISKLNKIKMREKDKNINFVFLGSYNERKNQRYLVEAFRYLPKNYILNLYGNKKTAKDYIQKLEKYIDKYNMTNINIFDFNKDVVSIFSKNDYLVSASKKEAQSLAVIQALASGKPIVGIENETIDQIVNMDNGLKLSKKTTTKKFAEKIKFFTEKVNYKQCSKQCIKDSKMFDENKVISKIKDFYQRVSNSHTK